MSNKSKVGINKFLEQMKVRRKLWLTLLERCSVLQGDGTRSGETATLNSLFLVGKLALNETTSDLLNSLLCESKLNSYLFLHLLKGSLKVQLPNRPVETIDSGLVILDISQFGDLTLRIMGDVCFFLLSKSELELSISSQSIHGFRLSAEDGSVALFRVLDVLEKELPFVEHSQLKIFKYAVQGAIIGDISNRINLRSARKSLLSRIKEYINKNYFNQKLSVKSITNEFQISRSHLYRLFNKTGGVQEYIRKRRLERLHNDLLRNGINVKTLKAMAYDYGFSSGHSLKRYFHDEYGFDPIMR